MGVVLRSPKRMPRMCTVDNALQRRVEILRWWPKQSALVARVRWAQFSRRSPRLWPLAGGRLGLRSVAPAGGARHGPLLAYVR